MIFFPPVLLLPFCDIVQQIQHISNAPAIPALVCRYWKFPAKRRKRNFARCRQALLWNHFSYTHSGCVWWKTEYFLCHFEFCQYRFSRFLTDRIGVSNLPNICLNNMQTCYNREEKVHCLILFPNHNFSFRHEILWKHRSPLWISS